MTKNAAVFDVIGNVPSDLVDMVNTIIHAINEVAEDREEFVRRTITHWQTAKPDYNVVVLNNKWHHDVTIQNGVHYHVEIPRQVAGTHGFDVYVFKTGVITRHGDGGWINWGCSGRFREIGDATLKFFA